MTGIALQVVKLSILCAMFDPEYENPVTKKGPLIERAFLLSYVGGYSQRRQL